MNHKEKAIELYEKFHKLADSGGYYTDHEYIHGDDQTISENAKKCAMIVVDEIMEYLASDGWPPEIENWKKVRIEINKL